MKRNVVVILLVAALALGMAGCGGKEEASAQENTPVVTEQAEAQMEEQQTANQKQAEAQMEEQQTADQEQAKAQTEEQQTADQEQAKAQTEQTADQEQVKAQTEEQSADQKQAEKPVGEAPQEEVAQAGSEEELFQKFLSGEERAFLDYGDLDDLTMVCMRHEEFDGKYQSVVQWNGAESLSLQEIIAQVKETEDLDMPNLIVSYTLADTLSGGKALVLKFSNLGIDYFEFDESCAYFVVTVSRDSMGIYDHDILNLVYVADSWSRKYIQMMNGTVFTCYGAQGAGDSSEWYRYIDETGHCVKAYELRTLYDAWINDYAYEYMGNDTAWCEGLSAGLLTTREGSFFAFTDERPERENPDDFERRAQFIQYIESNGIVQVDSVEDKANDVMRAAGIDRETLEEYSGEWTVLE